MKGKGEPLNEKRGERKQGTERKGRRRTINLKEKRQEERYHTKELVQKERNESSGTRKEGEDTKHYSTKEQRYKSKKKR
jgi:hypothetical protein